VTSKGRGPPPGKPETSFGALGASPKLGGGNELVTGVVCERPRNGNMAVETTAVISPRIFADGMKFIRNWRSSKLQTFNKVSAEFIPKLGDGRLDCEALVFVVVFWIAVYRQLCFKKCRCGLSDIPARCFTNSCKNANEFHPNGLFSMT
jgi:hypothetical protein